MSARKPFNDRAGYIASRKHPVHEGWMVIYLAEKQGVDVGGNKYAVVCEEHHTMTGASSLPKARESMKSGDFCEECAEECAPDGMPEPGRIACRLNGCTVHGTGPGEVCYRTDLEITGFELEHVPELDESCAHTPGPWQAGDGLTQVCAAEGMRPVAECGLKGIAPAERVANARLTAAAPVLYKSCKLRQVGVATLKRAYSKGDKELQKKGQELLVESTRLAHLAVVMAESGMEEAAV